MATEINTDGLAVRYGTYTSENTVAAAYETDGQLEELVVDFDYSTVASVGYIANRSDNALIPAGSVIKDITLTVGTAWVGGTSIALDFEDSVGATTPAAGLAAVLTAALTAGSVKIGAGAAVGASVPSANSDVALNVTAVGAFTAGTARAVVRYLRP